GGGSRLGGGNGGAPARGRGERAGVGRPRGGVVVLDIPARSRRRALHRLWFDRVVPRLGALVSGDATAYSYLPASARRFPAPAELAERMAAAGLAEVAWRTFMGGIVALHHGRVSP